MVKLDVQGCKLDLFKTRVSTPIGSMVIEACSDGLHSAHQERDEGDAGLFAPHHPSPVKLLSECNNCHVAKYITWLNGYFSEASLSKANKSGNQDVAIPRLCTKNHSDFRVKVWIQLMTTRCGETLSYSDLAERTFGHRTASRAVGTAMKLNPYQLLVPCHRVVKSTGEVGRYARGATVKEHLIAFEANKSSTLSN